MANDSWLDSSDTICNSKTKTKTKTKKNGAAKSGGDDDDDDDLGSGKTASYVPVKGQKMAANRLKKIQGSYLFRRFHIQLKMNAILLGENSFFLYIFNNHWSESLAKGLVDTEKIEKKIDKQKTSKTAKNAKATTKSPSKRAQRFARRSRQHGARDFVELDFDSDSDLDLDESFEPESIPPNHVSAHRPPHDPNLIVLDCDDEFMGGPAVNFSRNIAGANAVSMEQSQEMKVNVRVNNKIEQFQMNPVS